MATPHINDTAIIMDKTNQMDTIGSSVVIQKFTLPALFGVGEDFRDVQADFHFIVLLCTQA
jgi:hypothetical protein